MILYFSGTGNSRYAARLIASVTGDTVLSLNDRMRNLRLRMCSGDTAPVCSDTPLVFVCPVYAWRIPRVVESLIKATAFSGCNKAYFVLTCGDSVGDAARYAKRLCDKKGLVFMGLAAVVMPENYIAIYHAPDKEEADAIIARANPVLTALAHTIKEQKPLPHSRITANDRFKSAITNRVFYPFVVSAKGFMVTDACISCAKCEALCPLNNITLREGKPVWGSDCTHCMACICACPTETIEYKKNTKGKVRYYLDE